MSLLKKQIFLVVTCLTLLNPDFLLPQDRDNLQFSASAGISPYDLAGTGTGTVLAFELDLALTSFFLIEPGVRLFKYTSQTNTGISHLLPEVSLQLQLPSDFISPYVGAGAGISTVVEGKQFTEPTLHTALGIRILVQPQWQVRTEARLRSIKPWVGSAMDFTVGISRSF